ncbi:uncharacterized protein [Aegilops tauschii subsp. strangulata]|uniref:uncharacterized protein isoform X2 n=1 Tax=Aegilops tauschii subsp. strangulata TaxID=200361 RepID=UPI003CC849A2
MKLSDAEKKEIKIGRRNTNLAGSEKPQAIGKLMSDRPAPKEALESTLGRIWSPFKGVECKNLGMNRFLFSFRDEAGKLKALNDRPWTFNKRLLVVEDFDPAKTLNEYEFKKIPIWVRLHGIPMGSMYRESGEAIGKEIGEVLDVDVDECGMAAGEFMRVKVRLDITKPLMRGISIFLEDDEEERQDKEMTGEEKNNEQKGKEILFTYEHLPDFCYICGVIGHNDRGCPNKQNLGVGHEFGSWLKAEDWGRRPSEEDRSRNSRDKWGFGKNSTGGNRGSDAITWRKNSFDGEGVGVSGKREEKEATSPLNKQANEEEVESGGKKFLLEGIPSERIV